MKLSAAAATTTTLLLHFVTAQFVTPPTDLTTAKGYAGISVRYKQVPTGICELDPNVESYSGYADVAQNQHIFWWFFEARDVDPEKAPLTVWINGGPGSSSMLGLWQELGPCGVDYKGDVYSNPWSWTNVSNFLFIDQPTDVGFSYSKPVPAYQSESEDSIDQIQLPSNTCPEYVEDPSTCGTWSSADETFTANTTASVAPNMWKTLQGFMGAFPKYSRHGFNFATESYGGHYGPIISEYIEEQNARRIAGAHRIHLMTLAIGNGWYDPLIQFQSYYNYSVDPGNPYDYKPFNASVAQGMYNALYGPGNCISQLQQCNTLGTDGICADADTFCARNVEYVLDDAANRDEYDIRELMPDPFPYSHFEDYLNTRKVQQAIGAFTNWSDSNPTVAKTFAATGDDAREAGTIEALRKLLRQNVTVALYAGDADYNCNYLGNEIVAGEVRAPGIDEAGYTNLRTSDGEIHGVVKQAGGFSFTRVYDSGHEVPFYKGRASLELFERAIKGRDIATGRKLAASGFITDGPLESLYREGRGTVQFKVLDEDASYNPDTNLPGPPRPGPPVGAGDGVASTRAAMSVRPLRSRMKKRGKKTKAGRRVKTIHE
ncbi:MAG: hypothetical protein M1831_003463 [Alyxoria varia]|nr:MAG: hypothetical protein M1831_003463 [Alyxoria varia]